MNKIISVISIVFAFTLGTIFSADIATAVKPIEDVFVANTDPILVQVTNIPEISNEVLVSNADPIPVQVTNIPEINDEVLVVNTDPIQVTGIVASTTEPSAFYIVGDMLLDGCDPASASLIDTTWSDLETSGFFNSQIQGFIVQVEMTETSFVAKGIYDAVSAGCALGSHTTPHVFTFTGDCGEGVTVDVTTTGGPVGTITGNIACVP